MSVAACKPVHLGPCGPEGSRSAFVATHAVTRTLHAQAEAAQRGASLAQQRAQVRPCWVGRPLHWSGTSRKGRGRGHAAVETHLRRRASEPGRLSRAPHNNACFNDIPRGHCPSTYYYNAQVAQGRVAADDEAAARAAAAVAAEVWLCQPPLHCGARTLLSCRSMRTWAPDGLRPMKQCRLARRRRRL